MFRWSVFFAPINLWMWRKWSIIQNLRPACVLVHKPSAKRKSTKEIQRRYWNKIHCAMLRVTRKTTFKIQWTHRVNRIRLHRDLYTYIYVVCTVTHRHETFKSAVCFCFFFFHSGFGVGTGGCVVCACTTFLWAYFEEWIPRFRVRAWFMYCIRRRDTQREQWHWLWMWFRMRRRCRRH